MRSQKRFALCLVPRINYILIVFPLFPIPQILFYQEFRVHEYLQGSTYLITIGGLLGAEYVCNVYLDHVYKDNRRSWRAVLYRPSPRRRAKPVAADWRQPTLRRSSRFGSVHSASPGEDLCLSEKTKYSFLLKRGIDGVRYDCSHVAFLFWLLYLLAFFISHPPKNSGIALK